MNRGSVSTGYDIDNSLKVERTNTEYLKRVVSSAGNAKVWCASMWIKRSELDGTNQYWQFFSSMTSDGSGGYSGWPTRIGFFYSADQLWVDSRAGSGNKRLTSLQRLRDTSAWYHIVVMQDTTQSTDTNRTKIYINGTLLLPADLDYDEYPAQNDDTAMNVANSQIVVGAQGDGGYPWSGYIADVHFLDGQSGKTASDFGEYDDDSGIWKPKAYAGAYGTNGFHLKFEDGSNMGLDSSGNGNNLTSNNITAADQATDTPTNNFCTFLSDGTLFSTSSSDNPTFKQGGTEQIANGGTGWVFAYGTQAASSGKWYWEGKVSSTKNCMIGACPVDTTAGTTTAYLGQQSNGTIGFQYGDGNIFYWTGATEYVAGGGGVSTNDIIGFAMDLDNNKAYVSRNGTWLNSADPAGNSNGHAILDKPYMFAMARYNPSQNNYFNFGGFPSFTISSAASDANGYGTFEYAPPTGFYAMCGKNLAEFGGSA
tara:strand:- start:114 stop:1556 length:1443 start_codon:yes stop_codon:yes gene_type:complete